MSNDKSVLKAIRIAWISSERTWKDFSALLGPLAIGLSDGTVQITGVCCKGEDEKILPSPPIHFIHYDARKWFGVSGKEKERLLEELKHRRIQLVHGLDMASARLSSWLAENLQCPYLLNIFFSCDMSLLRKLDPAPGGIITSSNEIGENLSRHFSMKKDAIFTVPSGVIQVSQPTCFWENDTTPLIVVGANLSDRNHSDKLLQALGDLRKKGKDFAVFMVAQDTTDWKIRHKAMEYDLNDILTFVDLRDGRQMQGIFKAADVYIFMKDSDPTLIQPLLAMGSGVPVMSPNNVKADFIVQDQTAIIYDPASPEDISGRLTWMFDDNQIAQQYASRALEYLSQYHRSSQMTSGTLQAYHKTIERTKE